MSEQMVVEEPQKTKAFMAKPYSNQDKIKKEEEELEQLIAEQKGEVKETVEEEPLSAEEKSFKKRYGDLRRHMQEEKKSWEDKFEKLQSQLDSATKKEMKLPTSDEQLDAWMKKYPDVARIVETIAIKKAKEQASELEERVKAVDEMRESAAKQKAEVELLQIHPDFADIRESDDFHNWAEEQPKWVQDALYENGNDAKSAARAIDLYKADKNIKTRKASNPKDAARSVNSRNSRTQPDTDSDGIVFKESVVNKMTAAQYEKAADDIMEAIRTGKFIYDMSGSAR